MKAPRETPFPNEKAFQAAAMKRIRDRAPDGYGGVAYHPIGTGASKAGEPDILGSVPGQLIRGRLLACELKQPGKKPTPLQYKRLRDYAAAGALAGWATTMVEVDELLSHVDDPTWVNPQLAR